jgi:hypothetical protein
MGIRAGHEPAPRFILPDPSSEIEVVGSGVGDSADTLLTAKVSSGSVPKGSPSPMKI